MGDPGPQSPRTQKARREGGWGCRQGLGIRRDCCCEGPLHSTQGLGSQPGKCPVNSRWGKWCEPQHRGLMDGRFLKMSEEAGAGWTGNRGEGGRLGPEHRAACRPLQVEQLGTRDWGTC